MNKEPVLVALYARISTDGQDSTNQISQLENFARDNGWIIYKQYVDEAVSGSRCGSSRPAFSQMMEDAKEKKFQIVIFWSLDRLSREGTSQTLNYLNQLSSYGVCFRSYTEQYLDSCGAFKDAVLAILACIAKQERIRISERTKAGLERTKRVNGTILGRKSVLSPEVIAQIQSLRATGSTIRAIASQCRLSIGVVHRICTQQKVS
jgi:DNA invertase Pin-like site-specific DNA recombinase